MYCKNCGSIIPDQARFCKFCGMEHNKSVEPENDESSQENDIKQKANDAVSSTEIVKGISSLKLGGLATGLLLVGAAVILTIIRKADYGDSFERQSSSVEVLNNTYSVTLSNDVDEKFNEELLLKADFDKEQSILFFGTFTEYYNRKDWKGTEEENIPVPYRHTKLNSEWSEVYIVHQKSIEISDLKQKAYLVPQYKWNNLKPFEEHREAQVMLQGGEKLMDWALGKIPFSEKILNKIIEKGDRKSKQHEKELLNVISQNYIIERIPPHVPSKLAGYTETARDYRISFETKDVGKEEKIYLIASMYLGDPSQASSNSFPNKRGKSEYTIVEFELSPSEKNEKKIENSSIADCLAEGYLEIPKHFYEEMTTETHFIDEKLCWCYFEDNTRDQYYVNVQNTNSGIYAEPRIRIRQMDILDNTANCIALFDGTIRQLNNPGPGIKIKSKAIGDLYILVDEEYVKEFCNNEVKWELKQCINKTNSSSVNRINDVVYYY